MAIIDTFLLLSICANLSMSRKTELPRSPIRAFSVGRPVLNCLKEKREKLCIAAAIHSFSRIGLVFLSSADAQFHLAKSHSTASLSGFSVARQRSGPKSGIDFGFLVQATPEG